MNAQSKEPRWQRRAEDRPREICAAALDLFAEKGFAAARLDEIARRAGVSKGTLYLYFHNKEDLFRAVVRDTVAPNVEVGTGEECNLQNGFVEQTLFQHGARPVIPAPPGEHIEIQ